MKMLKSFSLVLGLCLLVAAVSWAAGPVQSLKIYATDGVKYDSLLLGADPAATNHVDEAFGEVGLPPTGPVFDVRFLGKTGNDTLPDGSMINIHKLVYVPQTDVYKVQFQSGDDGTYMTFSWQAGLGSLYGGYWVIMNSSGTEILCDMTTTTHYTYPEYENTSQSILIVKGDNIAFFTATADSLISAKNAKSKAGIEKKAYNQSEADFDFVQNASDTSIIKILHVEFSQTLLSYSITGLDKITSDAKFAKFDFSFVSGASIPKGTTVYRVHAIGNKGKALLVKKYYFTNVTGGKMIPAKGWTPSIPAPLNARLRLPEPNWWNIGEGTFALQYPGSKTGIIAGSQTLVTAVDPKKGTLYHKFLIHPKFKNIMGALVSKLGVTDPAGTYGCFTTLGGKPFPVNKAVGLASKSPDLRFQSKLYAELLALKLNVDVSKAGFMGSANTMFGKMHYKTISGDPVWANGMVVDTIIDHADNYLSACDDTVYGQIYTGAELLRVVQRINALYSAKFDTASWDVSLVLKSKPVPLVGGLYRESFSETAPVAITGNYVETTPLKYSLDQNYPNPFNPSTTIAFNLPKDAFVTLKVYNTIGQEVATVLDHAEFTEGNNEVEFNASSLASGVYFYQLLVNDGEFRQVKKMMLLK